MISAASRQAIPNEWIDFRGSNVGYVKPEFRDQVLETLKKEGAASRARLTERLESGDWDTRLTEEQKRYLKDSFDLKNMSWEDYQSLIDKLCEFGALDQEGGAESHPEWRVLLRLEGRRPGLGQVPLRLPGLGPGQPVLAEDRGGPPVRKALWASQWNFQVTRRTKT